MTAKRDALVRRRDASASTDRATLAVGDGANDLAMLSEAGLGVAFHAKPAVAAAARMRVDHGDLTALLYAQGYAVTDFASFDEPWTLRLGCCCYGPPGLAKDSGDGFLGYDQTMLDRSNTAPSRDQVPRIVGSRVAPRVAAAIRPHWGRYESFIR